MRHYQSDLKKRYPILIIVFVVISYLIYIAQVKIPEKKQKNNTGEEKIKNSQNIDPFYEEDMYEEFQNLPSEDKNYIIRLMPHY